MHASRVFFYDNFAYFHDTLAREELKRFNHEICNSKTSQLLFYDKLYIQ